MAGGDSNSCNSGNCDGKGQVNIFYGSFSVNCSWRGTSRDVQWSRLKTLFKTVGFGCFTTINVSAEEGKKKKHTPSQGGKETTEILFTFFSEFHYWTNCTRSISSGEIFHLGLLPLDNFGITYYVFMGWNHKCFMAVTNPWFSWISQPYSCAPSHSRVWLFFSSSSFFFCRSLDCARTRREQLWPQEIIWQLSLMSSHSLWAYVVKLCCIIY